ASAQRDDERNRRTRGALFQPRGRDGGTGFGRLATGADGGAGGSLQARDAPLVGGDVGRVRDPLVEQRQRPDSLVRAAEQLLGDGQVQEQGVSGAVALIGPAPELGGAGVIRLAKSDLSAPERLLGRLGVFQARDDAAFGRFRRRRLRW